MKRITFTPNININTELINYRTQQKALFIGISICYIYEELIKNIILKVSNNIFHNYDNIATFIKCAIMEDSLYSVQQCMKHLGSQGLFNFNYIPRIEQEIRGSMTAEGDILIICIKALTDILLEKTKVPFPKIDETLPLYNKEIMLIENIKKSCNYDYSFEKFNNNIVPYALDICKCIGRRLAYEAAKINNIDKVLLNIFNLYITDSSLEKYFELFDIMLLNVEKYVDDFNVKHEIDVPILDDFDNFIISKY